MVTGDAVRLAIDILFWIGVCGVVYPYLGYPLLLALWTRVARWPDDAVRPDPPPGVSMIIPVHNEASRIGRKVTNTIALRYPADRLQVIFVSDGSVDDTVARIRELATPAMEIVELPARGGKGAALNAGLARARHELVVFTDASIELEPDALLELVRQFADPAIGCVSGEDRIADAGGEGLYGRYELLLRRLESRLHSIVGASGSFYAQRRAICQPFVEGMAPDYLSVLRTVAQGYRAVTEPRAVGAMTSVKDPRQEFQRKVRTVIRGMTTLFAHPRLLDPFRYGTFAFAQWSHKVLRWMAPLFLLIVLLAPLARLDSPFYLAVLAAQVLFYLVALLALAGVGPLQRSLVGKIALYFSSVNVAMLAAWLQYGRGVRQELWTPSQR